MVKSKIVGVDSVCISLLKQMAGKYERILLKGVFG
jgi:hypothetical protein